MAIFIWVITTAVSLMILYLVVRSAINNSVMADLYHETHQLTEQQIRNGKTIAQLSEELGNIRRLMEERQERPQ